MTNYLNTTVDQYMRSVLADEFSVDEADNALTALTALTTAYPSLFPHERTFVRPEHDRSSSDHPAASGVRFLVFGDEGVERLIRLPRAALDSLQDAINETFEAIRTLVRMIA